MSKITEKILQKLGDQDLVEKLGKLSNSELNSLLLDVMSERTMKASPVQMVKSYSTNRFCVPSKVDMIAYRRLETELLELAKSIDIDTVLLSPVAPLGNCTAFGCVDQNNVVSATRGVEVLADPTNMLATIIAQKLKLKEIDNTTPIHLCTTTRVTRAQPLINEYFFAHFGIFCMVSSGKDRGSYSCEKELLLKHLQYYTMLLVEKYNAELYVVLRKRGGYTDSDGFFNRFSELIQAELPDVPFEFDVEHEDNNYYKGINFKIYMIKSGEKIEIGDGGFVDWMTQMNGDRKERMLISGIGIDRMLLF